MLYQYQNFNKMEDWKKDKMVGDIDLKGISLDIDKKEEEEEEEEEEN
jgi:hypothetical protein